MRTPARTEVVASERLIVGARWLIGLWAVVQVTVDSDYYPPHVRGWAYALIAVLLVGNVALGVAIERTATRGRSGPVVAASMTFDVTITVAFLFLYAFDPDRSAWALVFVLPVTGAARFRMPGVLWSWFAVAVLYVAKDVWAAATYGHPVRLSSLTFRMGLVLLVGVVAGRIARQLHDQKAELAEALGEVERIDAWRSRLVQMLAHDVRSPLGSIDGTAQLLMDRRQELDESQVQRLLGSVRRQSTRVQHLALDLLDLARSENDGFVLTPARFDLVELLTDLTPLVVGEDTAVELEVPPILEVVADRQRLSQVYANLLGNAVRHGRPPVRVTLSEAGGMVELVVADRGEGVPPDREAALFDAFSAGPSDGSVGLGLWMSRLLVEAHGGTVVHERDPGAGETRFRVRLPRENAEIPPELAPAGG